MCFVGRYYSTQHQPTHTNNQLYLLWGFQLITAFPLYFLRSERKRERESSHDDFDEERDVYRHQVKANTTRIITSLCIIAIHSNSADSHKGRIFPQFPKHLSPHVAQNAKRRPP